MGHPDEPIFLVHERDQEFYVVEAILGRRWNELKQTNEYKIKWKYWSSPDHDSWEEEHRLKYCDELKTEFDRTHPGKRFFSLTDCINCRVGYRIASMSTTVAKKPKNETHSSAKSRQKSQSWKAATFSTAKQALAHQKSTTTSASSKRDPGLLGLSKEADASPLLKVTLAKSDQGYSVKEPSSAEKTVRSEEAPQNQELAKNSLSARKEQTQAMSSTSETVALPKKAKVGLAKSPPVMTPSSKRLSAYEKFEMDSEAHKIKYPRMDPTKQKRAWSCIADAHEACCYVTEASVGWTSCGSEAYPGSTNFCCNFAQVSAQVIYTVVEYGAVVAVAVEAAAIVQKSRFARAPPLSLGYVL